MKKIEERYKLIGSKIKEARESAELSQLYLAEKVGFESATAISLIEAGNRKVSIKDLEKIAIILHKDINFFLGKKEKEIDLRFALRADKNLSKKDEEQILNFINFIKENRSENSKK